MPTAAATALGTVPGGYHETQAMVLDMVGDADGEEIYFKFNGKLTALF